MQRAVFFWYFAGFLACSAHVTFTNLKCSSPKESHIKFQECRIKAVNRTHKYIFIYAKNDKIFAENITANAKLLRYDHGYKPYFFDLTIDVCKFLKNPNNIVANLFYNTFKRYSNLNHTCPYNHDFIVDKLWTGDHEAGFGKYIFVPNGDYITSITFFSYNIELCSVAVYARKS